MIDNPPLPKSVMLGACEFRVQETLERSIIFSEAMPIYGFGQRIVVERLKDGLAEGIWYVEANSQDRPEGNSVVMSHLEKACRFARLWRGEDFEPWAPREPYHPESGLSVVEHEERERKRREAVDKIRSQRGGS